MARIRIYHDTRYTGADAGQAAPVKIIVTNKSRNSFIPLGISVLPSQWDAEAGKVIGHPQRRTYNEVIRNRLVEVEAALLEVGKDCNIATMTASELRDAILHVLNPNPVPKKVDENTVEKVFLRFLSHKDGSTKRLYRLTFKKIKAFAGNKFSTLKFEDINKEWLQSFDDYMALSSPSANARNINLRNLRTVFNEAIDNEITANYPFRRFKIKPEPTRKRNFTVDVIRKIFNLQGLEQWQLRYLDLFKLTFMLIGINIVDLCNLMEVKDGRVDYVRAKTHKPYSIKVEPEAMEIINRYMGKSHLLDYLDTNKTYRIFYNTVCRGLASIKEVLNNQGVDVKELTTYWARHSWATIASSLDIPKDTIAAALGHGGNTVTDIYIEFDMTKVDVANRRVLDWVLYGKQ